MIKVQVLMNTVMNFSKNIGPTWSDFCKGYFNHLESIRYFQGHMAGVITCIPKGAEIEKNCRNADLFFAQLSIILLKNFATSNDFRKQ